MKILNFIFITTVAFCGNFSQQEKKIKNIFVYQVEKNSGGFIGVNEWTIKTNTSAKKYEITNEECLNKLQNQIKNLNKHRLSNTQGSIYILCEIHYIDASIQTMSVGNGNAGLVKIGSQIYSHSKSLVSTILFCK